MTFIHYNGQIAAVVGATGFHLAPHLEGRPVGDPECCFVAFMAAYALDVEAGLLPRPYTDEKAGLYARAALIDDADFQTMTSRTDLELARHFNVPQAEIAAKRDDLTEGAAGLSPGAYWVELTSATGGASRIIAVQATSEAAAWDRAERAHRGWQAIDCWPAEARSANRKRVDGDGRP